MKYIILTVLFSTAVSVFGYSQNSGAAKLFENSLRYWYPIGVQESIITQNLKEGNKTYDISDKKMSLKSLTSGSIFVDKIITVQISSNPNVAFPVILYMMYEGVCTGMVYLDLFENLPKWKDVLKNAQTVEDNHFVSNNLVHYIFKLSPKEGLIYIQIDVTY